MPVLKTTSPCTVRRAPNERPSKHVRSRRMSFTGGCTLLGTGREASSAHWLRDTRKRSAVENLRHSRADGDYGHPVTDAIHASTTPSPFVSTTPDARGGILGAPCPR